MERLAFLSGEAQREHYEPRFSGVGISAETIAGTTLGDFQVTGFGDSPRASFGETVQPAVPEPSSFWLAAIGGLVLLSAAGIRNGRDCVAAKAPWPAFHDPGLPRKNQGTRGHCSYQGAHTRGYCSTLTLNRQFGKFRSRCLVRRVAAVPDGRRLHPKPKALAVSNVHPDVPKGRSRHTDCRMIARSMSAVTAFTPSTHKVPRGTVPGSSRTGPCSAR